ncbi:MAG: sialate O-acetylesterase [Muribaculaceae bacterium]|nr:sialate O-acetylesterase [Muribaculaceae bacterium]
MKRIILTLIAVAAACMAIQAQPLERTANQDKYYVRRATHFDDLPVYRHDIIMLGNSLTDGAEWNELFNNPHIKNRGIIGDIVQGLYERMEPILKGKPRKIFILSGVNDVSHGVDGDSIGRAMEKLIVLIKKRSPRTKIYLQSMLPFNTDVQMWKLLVGREQVVIDGNRAMEEVCKRQGVTWINLYPLFVDENGKLREDLTNDGLHLLGPGYLIWRDAIKKYMK